jgi:hypothetical protein
MSNVKVFGNRLSFALTFDNPIPTVVGRLGIESNRNRGLTC